MDKDISRDNLMRHGIYYEPNVYQGNHENTQSATHSLPDHVDAVRDGLLCMEKILPEDCDATLREELAEFGSVDIGPDWCLHPPCAALVRGKHHERMLQQSASHDNLRFCERIAERAQEILMDSESEWTFFWRSEIFKLFSDEAREHPNFSSTLDAWSFYENVRWNEFGNVARPSLFAPDRTQPKPDLTYAFPIQTSTPERCRGFSRDELTQSLSLQSLRKLVEQGVACAPTTALRKSLDTPARTGWKSSDRSCFPWAIVEIKKDVSAPNDDAIARCYSQAANAAAAALDIQAQLFDKLYNNCPLQPPPVVAFTCVGPVVKVWLAYQQKSTRFASSRQRMVCIWSTSVTLTWGVASLRAIIRNMHTWSSRLLKPKLQAAVLQVSANLSTSGQADLEHPSSQVHHPVTDAENNLSTPSRHPSQATPIISQALGEPITPVKDNTLALIDTATQSSCLDGTSPRNSSQAIEPSSSKNDVSHGLGDDVFSVESTTRTPGLYGRATSSRAGLFNPRVSFGTQIAIKTGRPFGIIGTCVARGSGSDTSGSELDNVRTRDGPFGPKGAIDDALWQRGQQLSASSFRSSPATACVSSSKPAFDDSGTNNNSVPGGSPECSKPSFGMALGNPSKITSLPASRDTDVCDLTTAFESASLQSVSRDHGANVGTAGTPFSAYTETDDNSALYQTITCLSPYQDFSLEELRLADYDRGRRYRSRSNEAAQCTDSASTEGNHTDNPDKVPLGAPRPGLNGLSGRFVENASYRADDNSKSAFSSSLNTSKNTINYNVDDAFAESDNEEGEEVEDDDNDNDDDTGSDTSRSSSPRNWISGERSIDLPKLKEFIRFYKKSQQQQILESFDLYRDPDGTYRIPLAAVVRRINMTLRPADRIF
ncbi:hypothetical protein BU24DRAFT_495696, partial [Aaosphaeria arxii CBS 175.79]